MTSNLKWSRADERAIVRGNQSISKDGIPPNVDYTLFENGVVVGHGFKTSEEAIKAADARRKAA